MPRESDKLLHLKMDDDLIGRVEGFQFRNRFQSRSAAIRWLVKTALDNKLRPEGITFMAYSTTNPPLKGEKVYVIDSQDAGDWAAVSFDPASMGESLARGDIFATREAAQAAQEAANEKLRKSRSTLE